MVFVRSQKFLIHTQMGHTGPYIGSCHVCYVNCIVLLHNIKSPSENDAEQ